MSAKTKTTLWEAQFAPDDYPSVVDAHSRVCICPSVDTNEHALLITRCVNAHDDLLAALERCSMILCGPELQDAHDQARAAIARAKRAP